MPTSAWDALRCLWEACSAAFRAQLTQPAAVVRLHPFLREKSLIVISEDVHQLEHDEAASRRKGADRRLRELRTRVPVMVVWHAT
jgi:hypothetical protein